MATIDTRAGHRICWSDTGTEGARQALMIHCSLAHRGAWRGVQRQLSDMLSMRAFDLPGHGDSADWDGVTEYQDVGAEVASSLIDTAPGGPVDLIGHSYGATIALRVAQMHPDKVRSLTLIEPVMFHLTKGQPIHEAYVAEMAPCFEALRQGDTMRAAQLFNRIWGAGSAWDAVPAVQRQAMAERMPLIAAGAPVTDGDVNGQAAPGALEAVRCPVLLIEGALSPPIVAAIHDAFQARLPDVQRVVVERAGHMVPITHPREVARALRAKWRRRCRGFWGLAGNRQPRTSSRKRSIASALADQSQTMRAVSSSAGSSPSSWPSQT